MAGLAGARARGKFAGAAMPTNAKKANEGMDGRQGYRPSGLYLFVPHPGCCPICHTYGLSPHVSRTPDVAFITHPNCLCATIEVPSEIAHDWNAIMKWARNPYGRMRFGWNYGQSLRTMDLTPETSSGLMKQWKDNVASGAWRRAKVSEEQKERIRAMVKAGELSKQKMVDVGAKVRAIELRKRGPWQPKPMRRAGVPKSKMLPSARLSYQPPRKLSQPVSRMARLAEPTSGMGGAMLMLGAGMAMARAKQQYDKEREARRRKAAQERQRLGYW